MFYHLYQKIIFTLFIALLCAPFLPQTAQAGERLTCAFLVDGSRKDMFRRNKLDGVVSIKRILHKKYDYGFGPAHLLQGDITIYDGVSYTARVKDLSSVTVEETPVEDKAVFLAYGASSSWQEITVEDDLYGLHNLEDLIEATAKRYHMDMDAMFLFRIEGEVDALEYSVLDKDLGFTSDRHSASTHERSRARYKTDTVIEANLIGAWASEKNAGLYADEDKKTHIHIISKDKTLSGHVHDLVIKKGTKIFMPRCH